MSKKQEKYFNFTKSVEKAIAGLGGMTFGYTDGDHHLGKVDVILDTNIDDVVIVTATFGVHDYPANYDDS